MFEAPLIRNTFYTYGRQIPKEKKKFKWERFFKEKMRTPLFQYNFDFIFSLLCANNVVVLAYLHNICMHMYMMVKF